MTLKLEVVTPKGRVLDRTVDEVSLPGALGEFGVLEGHIPVLSALRAGVLSYIDKGKTERLAVGGQGFAEVGGEKKVLVLTDLCMTRDEIDAGMAKEELADAQSSLDTYSGHADDTNYRRLQQQIEWAEARLALLDH